MRSQRQPNPPAVSPSRRQPNPPTVSPSRRQPIPLAVVDSRENAIGSRAAPVLAIIARQATLSSGPPLILAIQLWVDPIIATCTGAVATRTGDRVRMFIVPTDIGPGGDCLEGRPTWRRQSLRCMELMGPFAGDCDAILSALQDDDQNYGSAYRP